MKNLFFILVLAIGLMSFTSSSEVNKKQVVELQTLSQEGEVFSRCCNWTTDMLGNRYCKEVPCPDVIIVE